MFLAFKVVVTYFQIRKYEDITNSAWTVHIFVNQKPKVMAVSSSASLCQNIARKYARCVRLTVDVTMKTACVIGGSKEDIAL